MDLSVIIDHLDNFKTAWEGWDAVFGALDTIFSEEPTGENEQSWSDAFEGSSDSIKDAIKTSSESEA